MAIPTGMEALAERIRNEDAAGMELIEKIRKHKGALAFFTYLAALEDRIEELERQVRNLHTSTWDGP